MTYIVDEIIDDKVNLEDIKTKKIIIVDKSILPIDIVDGSVLKLVDGKYIINNEEKEERLKRIKEKLNNLKK